MAKTKPQLVIEAKELGVKIDTKATVAEIQKEIAAHKEKAADPPIKEKALTKKTSVSTEETTPTLAKAGKRSAKAQSENEALKSKAERKTRHEVTENAKIALKPSRNRAERRGKNFRKSAELIDKSKFYNLVDAISLAQETSYVKFNATVEVHVNLDVDPKVADQNIRDSILLPAGNGKVVRIAVLTDDPQAAKKAGADSAGNDDILAEIEKGKINFDILIATPALMPKLSKFARVLGPRGLMPNPKSGTVTTDINRAVAESKAGRVEYRVDSTGIIHLGIGKVSFTKTQLLQNLQAVLASITSNKPSSIKGNYFKTVHLTTTMGPSIAIDLNDLK